MPSKPLGDLVGLYEWLLLYDGPHGEVARGDEKGAHPLSTGIHRKRKPGLPLP
jgi:hypothetical protein